MWITIKDGNVLQSTDDEKAIAVRVEARHRGQTALVLRMAHVLMRRLGWADGTRLRVRVENKSGLTGRILLISDANGEVMLHSFPSVKNRLCTTFKFPAKYRQATTVHPVWRIVGGGLVFTLPDFVTGQKAGTWDSTRARKPKPGYRVSPAAAARLRNNLEKAREAKRILRELEKRGLVEVEKAKRHLLTKPEGEPIIRG